MAAAPRILDDELVRIRIVFIAMLLGFGLLLLAMWRIQVAHGEFYQRDLVKQSVRRVRLPGNRGRVFDANGQCLADNRPSYCIAIYLEELRQPGGWSKTIDRVELILDRLSQVLGVPPEITREDIETHIRKRLPLPLLAWNDIDERVLSKLSERAAQVPGVGVYVQALRTYPAGPTASHTLGYVGRAEPVQDEETPFHYYLPEMAGKSGIEKRLDGVLRGEAGGRLVRVDVSGFRYEDLAQRDPRRGSDVQLSLDLGIQRLAEETLGEAAGSVVVIDPRNGDVLALVSSPGYNPNDFVPSISTDAWNAILEDELHPLLNRAVAGSYAPGSIFKPVVAMAALENGLATGATSFECPGYFDLGNTRFRCWTRGQHGLLTMREAIQHSCNVYFFHLGLKCGPDYIYHMAAALGLGEKTGISLDFESSGVLPNEGWVRRTQGHGWRKGDTCNLSIGQGYLTVTPLQMALVAATLANGGHRYRPRLVKGIREPGSATFRRIPPKVVTEMNWSKSSMDVVRGGMRDVVMSERGTGKLAYVEGATVAGKTGTAEYGKKEEGKKRGWMIAFAPYDEPRYAIAIVVDNAVSGGVTVAPKMQQLLTGLLGTKTREGRG